MPFPVLYTGSSFETLSRWCVGVGTVRDAKAELLRVGGGAVSSSRTHELGIALPPKFGDPSSPS